MGTTVKEEVCTKCGASNYSKEGLGWRAGKRIQRYRCKACGSIFVSKEAKEDNGGNK